jgi:hypothetical protein
MMTEPRIRTKEESAMTMIRSTFWAVTGLVGLAFVFTPALAVAQTCHVSDTYIEASLCVGFDCVCGGGGFGFDTVQLKENNLRIKFQDTSNSASFPTRDWQIRANDSTNGGLNRFSIDDIDGGTVPFTIEGGANGAAGVPSNSFYMDNSGKIGLGTSNPVVDLHVVSGNTPTLRLEQDGSSGFTPQTWDVAGNETNFFVRDVTMGSLLPFRIRPGAPTDSIEIEADGDVEFGSANTTIRNGGMTNWELVNRSADGDFAFNNADAPGAEFIFEQDGVFDAASACIELGGFACTAAVGNMACVAGTCP